MSADFWAGYISGAIGIVIGNPLDIVKVRLQAALATNPASPAPPAPAPAPASAPGAQRTTSAAGLVRGASSFLTAGTAAPVLGYGALNALLFVSYHRAEAALNHALGVPPGAVNLWTTWLGGAVGGLATWVVSTPTELVKCRAQLAVPLSSAAAASPSHRPHATAAAAASSWRVARQVWRTEGLRGFYLGGTVTALRDSVGYGFYFWAYQLATRYLASASPSRVGSNSHDGGDATTFATQDAVRVLLCGGIAGIVTWASIFPLDVIKTRLQTQAIVAQAEGLSATSRTASPTISPVDTRPLLSPTNTAAKQRRPPGALEIARAAYREGGVAVFFRGLGVCSVRAFIVNAVQWAVYEWIMLRPGASNPSVGGVG